MMDGCQSKVEGRYVQRDLKGFTAALNYVFIQWRDRSGKLIQAVPNIKHLRVAFGPLPIASRGWIMDLKVSVPAPFVFFHLALLWSGFSIFELSQRHFLGRTEKIPALPCRSNTRSSTPHLASDADLHWPRAL